MRRLALLFLLALLVGAGIAGIGVMRAVGRGGAVLPGAKTLLTYRLAAPLPDYPRDDAPLPLPGFEREASLADLWAALSAARTDDRVAGLALHVRDAGFGLAKAEEVRRQLALLAGAGKPVECYFETTGEGVNGTLEYYVASACSSISLAPAGEVALLGLFYDAPFLRGSLDKLKIEPSFLTAGEFKSAAEIFTEQRHSPAARQALDAVLEGYFSEILDGIADGRQLPRESVRALFDRGPLSAAEAVAAGLVDQIAYPDEFEERLDALGDDLKRQGLLDYGRRARRGGGSGARVAVVFAQGTIVRGGSGSEGWSDEFFLGSDDLCELLESLADDDDVKAVVLRVDSPGGSALASDLILRRVELLAQAKPVVVSMSDVAASGGYYIAARAREIIAEAGTLTGSIGVVAGKLATERFQRELLGATHDPLQRGAHAGLYSSLRPFDEAERALMQRRLDATYDRFLDHVAAGRELDRDAVAAVAEGRVWTGRDAVAVGLVDRLGGLDAALGAAREAAGLPADGGGVQLLPEAPGLFEWLARPRPPRLAAGLQQVLARLAAPRAPFELELPADLAGLARPF